VQDTFRDLPYDALNHLLRTCSMSVNVLLNHHAPSASATTAGLRDTCN